ncbi:basic amino acid/polyamine antiporter [Curtobacterium sp. A7_M15]|uniref:basic amino acid/polyamine antiporter n=1 Tax=Curtobacterium sp. A7_M15 TaxID=3065241 RepID=UPI002737C2B3|nr:basic amino acid/polyamine antiporter [Curtobacterium sp. A7_M15]MDP4332748.1 basic amino acid/polyamine antiporter [Curtobacterium sp. A7_M15]
MTVQEHDAPPTTEGDRSLSVIALAAMVVGSMVGAGVFSLPRNFASGAGVVATVIAWVVAGVGMLMLVFVFQALATHRPDLDAGIFAYAKAGFGNYVGFFSAFGYWASACVGNVTYWVLIGSTLGSVIPAFGEGDTLLSVLVTSVLLWAFHLFVLRGTRNAAVLNTIVTVAKLVPILLFLVVGAVVGTHWDTFRLNLWGGAEPSLGELFAQVRSTMLITVFVFLGVEGATVYSRYARRREDIGRATISGFLGVLAVFALVTLVSFAALPAAELQGLRQPSMAGVFGEVVGTWGAVLINVGLVVSVLGAYLAWTLMSSEVLFQAARQEDAPRFLTVVNRHGTPWMALLFTSGLIQVFLVITMFSDDALTSMLELCSSLSLIPYFLTALYAVQFGIPRWSRSAHGGTAPPGVDGALTRRQLAAACVAVVYTVFLVIAAGPQYLLLSFLIYAPATVLYVIARRERRLRVFTRWELVLCVVAVLGAVVALVGPITGSITL